MGRTREAEQFNKTRHIAELPVIGLIVLLVVGFVTPPPVARSQDRDPARAFATLDLNNGDVLSLAEYRRAPDRFKRRFSFADLDQNNDGRITRKEAAARLRAGRRTNHGETTAQSAPSVQTVAYGAMTGVEPNILSLDIYGSASGAQKPVIVMIHGGGWQTGDKATGDKANRNIITPKAGYYVKQGYVFVSINYRLAPDHPFPAHAMDSGNAVSWVYDNISAYGGDQGRIVLMGHSAGAHIAALISTDESYIGTLGHGLDILKGVVLLDTAAYDIPALVRKSGRLPRAYGPAFGTNRQIWQKASPITYAAADKNIPPAIVFYTDRAASKASSERFVQALSGAGVETAIYAAPDRTHESLSARIGEENDHYTEIIDRFLTDITK